MDTEEKFSTEELEIIEKAHQWVRANKRLLIEKFASLDTYSKDELPTTLFMAGSPGAGKTEISHRLAESFKQKPVIIDADEIRKLIEGYDGSKAYLFQKGASKGVHILFDYCCDKNLNIILDGTFAYDQALRNVIRSIDDKRNIEIYFIYQDPLLSWEFTKKRELKEKRNVPKHVFVDSYINSIKNVQEAKKSFGKDIKLNIVIKDFEKGVDYLELNKEGIETYIPKVYSKEELQEILQ